jgi:predicted deacylase
MLLLSPHHLQLHEHLPADNAQLIPQLNNNNRGKKKNKKRDRFFFPSCFGFSKKKKNLNRKFPGRKDLKWGFTRFHFSRVDFGSLVKRLATDRYRTPL